MNVILEKRNPKMGYSEIKENERGRGTRKLLKEGGVCVGISVPPDGMSGPGEEDQVRTG